ncbi:MAG: DMT family transporter, partial [Candidatus Poribacteria bacterium]|nr:DMT family transporter [Candidatus Poribacteria bacterium]
LGDILVLISGCFLGLRVVVTKLLVQSIHPYRLLVWYLSLSLPCYGVISFLFERGEPMQLTLSSAVALLYQGGVIAGFCFLAWTSILERYSASKLVVLFFATPLSGVLFSYLSLGDELTISLLAGAALVAAGIYLVNMRQ